MHWLLIIARILSVLFGGGMLLNVAAPAMGVSSAPLSDGLWNAAGLSIPTLLLGLLGFAPGLLGKIFPGFAKENGPAELLDAINAIQALVASPRDFVLQRVAAVQSMECAFAIAMAVLRNRLPADLLASLEESFRKTVALINDGFAKAEPPRLQAAEPFAAQPIPAKAAGRTCYAELLR